MDDLNDLEFDDMFELMLGALPAPTMLNAQMPFAHEVTTGAAAAAAAGAFSHAHFASESSTPRTSLMTSEPATAQEPPTTTAPAAATALPHAAAASKRRQLAQRRHRRCAHIAKKIEDKHAPPVGTGLGQRLGVLLVLLAQRLEIFVWQNRRFQRALQPAQPSVQLAHAQVLVRSRCIA